MSELDDVDGAAETAFGALLRGEPAELDGLGELTVRAYHAYTGRDPRTGDAVSVPAKRLPFLKVSSDARDHATADGRPRARSAAR